MGFSAKTVLALSFLVLAIVNVCARCPPMNEVRGPECRQDYDCRKGPCCPNWLGKKSCVSTVPFKSNNVHSSLERSGMLRAGQQKHGAGVYCDGVKCMPYQVCKPDRSSGRLRCQSP